jgi:hypothetical protein
MSTEITIPSQLVPHAREAATCMLRKAGADIMVQAECRDPKLEDVLGRFDAYRALLDTLPTKPDTAAHVGIEHAPVLRDAMREHTTTHAGIMASAHEEGREAARAQAAWVQQMTGELADMTAFTASLDLLDNDRDLSVTVAVEWQETDLGLVTRHGAWAASVERRNLEVRPGESFWHWRFDHDGLGHIASGLCRSREGAVECVEAELRKWTSDQDRVRNGP